MENSKDLVKEKVNALFLWENVNCFPDNFLPPDIRRDEFPIPLHVIINYICIVHIDVTLS